MKPLVIKRRGSDRCGARRLGHGARLYQEMLNHNRQTFEPRPPRREIDRCSLTSKTGHKSRSGRRRLRDEIIQSLQPLYCWYPSVSVGAVQKLAWSPIRYGLDDGHLVFDDCIKCTPNVSSYLLAVSTTVLRQNPASRNEYSKRLKVCVFRNRGLNTFNSKKAERFHCVYGIAVTIQWSTTCTVALHIINKLRC